MSGTFMTELSQADTFLIEEIRRGSPDGWTQLVNRYQGRLLAFARSQLRDPSQADDVVQETFIGFLRNVDKFESTASLETYLFTILRRRMIDNFRRAGRREEISVCSLQGSHGEPLDPSNLVDQRRDADMSASAYVARNEQQRSQEAALWQALKQVVERLQSETRFRDLQIAEMVFYAQLRNKEIAHFLQLDEKQVALVKHRMIKRLASSLSELGFSGNDFELTDETMLSRVWEAQRPSCPKRSTVGKWLLGTLQPEWSDYLAFHVDTLGCRFCQANRDDLRLDTQPDPARNALRDRIMQSSVGFFLKQE